AVVARIVPQATRKPASAPPSATAAVSTISALIASTSLRRWRLSWWSSSLLRQVASEPSTASAVSSQKATQHSVGVGGGGGRLPLLVARGGVFRRQEAGAEHADGGLHLVVVRDGLRAALAQRPVGAVELVGECLDVRFDGRDLGHGGFSWLW